MRKICIGSISASTAFLILSGVLHAEIINEFPYGEETYYFDWSGTLPPAEIKHVSGLYGKLSLYVRNKQGASRLIFSESHPAFFVNGTLPGQARITSLVFDGTLVWFTQKTNDFRTEIFCVDASSENPSKQRLPWVFGTGGILESGARFESKDGKPVLIVKRHWNYEQDIQHEFIPLGGNKWLEVSDGLNEIFVCPKNGLEWDGWIVHNTRKRNELRLKQNPNATLYPMPKGKSLMGILLEHPERIDDFLKTKVITEEYAEEIRRLARVKTRSSKPSPLPPDQNEKQKTCGDAARPPKHLLDNQEHAWTAKILWGVCTLPILFLIGLPLWLKIRSRRKKS